MPPYLSGMSLSSGRGDQVTSLYIRLINNNLMQGNAQIEQGLIAKG
ncbi:hypothetical protein PANA5342_pPANA10107 (plasmid) [Pantoea ananatis LMG 5342]|nr:hypothetical protein PANA5342_pPANA10107 [Pantoea ananatis LMG 5342]